MKDGNDLGDWPHGKTKGGRMRKEQAVNIGGEPCDGRTGGKREKAVPKATSFTDSGYTSRRTPTTLTD